jgi:glycosyltransferase involved in cell wall biosynthesis
VHVPYFSAPLVRGAPTIVTIHDAVPLALPVYAQSRRMRFYLRLRPTPPVVARLVITDSASPATTLFGGSAPGGAFVVPLGVSQEYRPVGSYEDEEALDRLRDSGACIAHSCSTGGFDICVAGAVDPGLRSPRGPRDEHDLRSSVQRILNETLYPAVEPLIRSLGLEERVRLVGFVSESDKRDLYRAAEGSRSPRNTRVGLDPLEVLPGGAPVICSNRTSRRRLSGRRAAGRPGTGGDRRGARDGAEQPGPARRSGRAGGRAPTVHLERTRRDR